LPLFAKEGDDPSLWQREVGRDFLNNMSTLFCNYSWSDYSAMDISGQGGFKWVEIGGLLGVDYSTDYRGWKSLT